MKYAVTIEQAKNGFIVTVEDINNPLGAGVDIRGIMNQFKPILGQITGDDPVMSQLKELTEMEADKTGQYIFLDRSAALAFIQNIFYGNA
jgi:hypothetical protein